MMTLIYLEKATNIYIINMYRHNNLAYLCIVRDSHGSRKRPLFGQRTLSGRSSAKVTKLKRAEPDQAYEYSMIEYD